MSNKLIYSVSFILALSMAGGALAELVGYWKFDEGAGTVATDSSGNRHDGTLVGDPQWVAGWLGGALKFDGDGDYVDVGVVGISGMAPRTITGWVKASTTAIPSWTSVFGFAPDGDTDGTYFDIEVDDAGNYVVHVGGWESVFIPVDTQWHHFAATYDGSGGSWYLDGQLIDSLDGAIGTIDQVRIGARLSNSNYFPGLIDDVRIYNTELTLAEIKKVMAGPKAYDPIPADGTLYGDTWVSLGWSSGNTAVSHDVYFGDNFDDVNAGTSGTFHGNQPTAYFTAGVPGSPCPDGLVPGTTYYWRIDEVNELHPDSPWKGSIWSFTVPSKTAYYPNPADGAEFVDPDVVLSWTAGFNAKLHTVYFGDNFDDVNNAAGGLPRGPTTYTPGPLKLERVYYWRVDEFDAVATYKGDVWSFTTLGAVGSPNPPNGATDVKMIPILSWQPGDSAASHQVYLGTDKDTVRNATTASPEYKGSKALGAESYDPGKLAWLTTYYWRIVEVNNVNPDGPWTGSIWSFTTGDFLTIDDFEAYNDLDPSDPESNRVFMTWKDGFGFGEPGVPPYSLGNGSGSVIGYADPPFVEKTIVHGGRQALPYLYDNNKQGYFKYSEAEMTLSYPRDWTEEGVDILTLWFYGDPANAPEPMYVAVSNATGPTAVVYHDNPNAALIDTWTEWNIDLEEISNAGVSLTDVDRIAIGFGNRNNPQVGGSGMVLIDDIRLYRPPPEPVEVEPETN